MKTLPIYMSRQTAIKRIINRNNKIASEYIEIAENLPKQNIDFLNNIRLSLAKFAHRKNCKLSFENVKNAVQMNIEREDSNIYVGYDLNMYVPFFKKAGDVVLSKNPNEKAAAVSEIKEGVKSILEKVKDENTSHVHYSQTACSYELSMLTKNAF